MKANSMKKKLTTAFIIIALFSLVVGGFGIVGMTSQNSNMEAVYNDSAYPTIQLKTVQKNLLLIGANYNKILYQPDQSLVNSRLAEIDDWTAADKEILAWFGEMNLSDEQRATYDQLQGNLTKYRGIRDEMNKYLTEGNLAAVAKYIKSFDAAREKVDNSIDQLCMMKTDDSAKVMAQAQQNSTIFRVVMIAICVIAVAVGLLLGKRHADRFSSPILELAKLSEAMAQGDFSSDVRVKSDDEIGILAEGMEKVIMALKGLVEETDKLAEAAREGKLSVRGEVERFEGEYKEILAGFNQTFETMAQVITTTEGYIEGVSRGEFNDSVDVEYPGDYAKISEGLNTCYASINKLVNEARMIAEKAIAGKLRFRADEAAFSGKYAQIVKGLNRTLDTLVSHIDQIPSPVMIVNNSFDIEYVNKSAAEMMGQRAESAEGRKCYDCVNAEDCRTKDCVCEIAMKDGISETRMTKCRPQTEELDISHTGAAITNEEGEVIGALEVMTDQKDAVRALTISRENAERAERAGEYQSTQVNLLIQKLERLARGDLSIADEVEPDEFVSPELEEIRNNFGQINDALAGTVGNIRSYVQDITRVLSGISSGDLDQEVTAEYLGDFLEIKESLNNILESLNGIMGEINQTADQVAVGAREVSNGSQALSQAATEQASSVEELNASITVIANQTRQNAIDAGEAQGVSNNVRDGAEAGNKQMADMLVAMEDINVSSSNISHVIKVIDDIAFQTNILALNAAVEAARAGAHGKGFAVVAEEVRNLAARSAEAAKQTTEMIEGSIKKVQAGTRMARETAAALNKMVTGVENSTVLVGNIAAASNEQATNIAQINKGIEQVAQVVHSISATSEQSASASEALSKQAEMMKNMVANFKTKKNATSQSGLSKERANEIREKAAEKVKEQEIKQLSGSNDYLDDPLDPMAGAFRASQRIILNDEEYDKY